MRDNLDLVLLIGTVTSVKPCRGRDAERLFWCIHAVEYKLGRMTQSLQMDDNLHSVQRQLIELRMEHADMDAMIDRIALTIPLDDLSLRRLKKRRLLLRDQISRLELELDPPTPA